MKPRTILLFLVLSCFPSAADAPPGTVAEARHEMFAARYEHAAQLYRTLLETEPDEGEAWYGLVRCELSLHHSRLAYAAANGALKSANQTPGAQTAAGLAMYRRGDLSKAETHFRAALKIKPDYPGAFAGLASVYSAVSLSKSARDLRLIAWQLSPDDPELIAAHVASLKGDERIRALEAVLTALNPSSEEARDLRVHIANERAAGPRKLRRLTSPYQAAQVKLFRVLDGLSRDRGVGIVLRLNGKQNARLLLDTGASGISIAPKLAEKAGLRVISGEAGEARGIGDDKPQSEIAYLADEARAGDVVFADYPIAVFNSAKSADYDGLIGADVFDRFLVKIDFPQLVLSLETRPGGSDAFEEPADFAGAPPAGFYRMVRFGDHLTIPTFINGRPQSSLFLLDSGSTSNLIDTDTAKEFAGGTSSDSMIGVRGIQGKAIEASRTGRVSLVFAGFRQDNPEIISISLEKMSDAMGVGFGGILGMPVLRNLAVTIDYREGTVKFDYRRP
ncbi:MAG TPA: aspartyl protease family protein [Bryobacteraceae bacterium]|nr:aspartyl protease family protein [Bryobacteraceae bacterium]